MKRDNPLLEMSVLSTNILICLEMPLHRDENLVRIIHRGALSDSRSSFLNVRLHLNRNKHSEGCGRTYLFSAFGDKGGAGIGSIVYASPTVFVRGKLISHVQASFCLQGSVGCMYSPSNPRLDGLRIYITLQSKLASSTVQPWVGRWWRVPFLL